MARKGENHIVRDGGIVATGETIVKGQAVYLDTDGNLVGTPAGAAAAGFLLGVACWDGVVGESLTYVRLGQVLALGTDGETIAVGDLITDAEADGTFRLAAATERVVGQARSATAGGTAELFELDLFPAYSAVVPGP